QPLLNRRLLLAAPRPAIAAWPAAGWMQREQHVAELRVGEGPAGNTIWAEHYDGALADVFDFQDRITARIVGTLESTLRITEAQRALQKRPESLDAYDCVLRAFTLLYRLSREEFAQAGGLLERAIALDPAFSAAYSWRAWWYL